jgi:ubiquinone biosynthesis monooxygenase Coq7
MNPVLSKTDRLLRSIDEGLRTVFAHPVPTRIPSYLDDRLGPGRSELTFSRRKQSGSLMRVNHVGEVCAQALYSAQALTSNTPQLQAFFERARKEESDHLIMTRLRLIELGDRPSRLIPIWYAGSFTVGFFVGLLGEPVSLGFVMESERQVEAHLHSHLELLPKEDLSSRAIVAQMAQDEAAHGSEAARLGGTELPVPIKGMMSVAARVMTTVAHYV